MPDIDKYCKYCFKKAIISTEIVDTCTNCGREYSTDIPFSHILYGVSSRNAIHIDNNLGTPVPSLQEMNRIFDRWETSADGKRVNRPYGVEGTWRFLKVVGSYDTWDLSTAKGKSKKNIYELVRRCKAELLKLLEGVIESNTGEGLYISDHLARNIEVRVKIFKRDYRVASLHIDILRSILLVTIGSARLYGNERINQAFWDYRSLFEESGKFHHVDIPIAYS